MKNARTIKEIIDNNVITKSKKIRGASIARPYTRSLKSNQNGITLIALIITIIVLLILVSITINLTLGERGIFNTAVTAKNKYSQKEAEEKLKLIMLDLQTEKVINPKYNEDTYITDKLKEKNFIVIDNTVIVDGWKFEIDRTIPDIVNTLEKEESKDIKIIAKEEYNVDFTKATIAIEIETKNDLEMVMFDNEEIKSLEKQEDKYYITKEVNKNKNYSIYARDNKKGYKTGNIKITGIVDNIEIENLEELVAFRDRVNKGATYEGKIVKIVNNIDLSSVCGESIGKSWIPIGNSEKQFKGILDGTGKEITGLYINNTENYQGLIGMSDGATIKNLTVSGEVHAYVHVKARIGGIIGEAKNGTIESCINKVEVNANDYYADGDCGGIVGNCVYVTINKCYNEGNVTVSNGRQGAGIAGGGFGVTVNECYNIANIIGNGESYNMGGIIGATSGDINNINNCYNIGNITGKDRVGGIVGLVDGWSSINTTSVTNSYNTGYLTSYDTSYNVRGGIIGCKAQDYYSSSASTTNSYYLNTCNGNSAYAFGATSKTDSEIKGIYSVLGNQFKQDKNNINKGYPILKWQEPEEE